MSIVDNDRQGPLAGSDGLSRDEVADEPKEGVDHREGVAGDGRYGEVGPTVKQGASEVGGASRQLRPLLRVGSRPTIVKQLDHSAKCIGSFHRSAGRAGDVHLDRLRVRLGRREQSRLTAAGGTIDDGDTTRSAACGLEDTLEHCELVLPLHKEATARGLGARDSDRRTGRMFCKPNGHELTFYNSSYTPAYLR
jgi:hypothetical protein